MTGASSTHTRTRTLAFVQTLFFFSPVFELTCLTVNQPITPHLPAGHRNLSSSDISDLMMTTFPHHSTTLRETVALDTKHEQTAAAAMMTTMMMMTKILLLQEIGADQTTAQFNYSSHHALCSAFCTGEWLLCSMFQCFFSFFTFCCPAVPSQSHMVVSHVVATVTEWCHTCHGRPCVCGFKYLWIHAVVINQWLLLIICYHVKRYKSQFNVCFYYFFGGGWGWSLGKCSRSYS